MRLNGTFYQQTTVDLSCCKPSIARRYRRQLNQNKKRSRHQRQRVREQAVVYVGNLPTGCTGRQVLSHFSPYISYIRHKVKIFEDQDSFTYTFLYFDSYYKAYEAIYEMNDSVFLGNILIVEEHDPEYERWKLQQSPQQTSRSKSTQSSVQRLKSFLQQNEAAQILYGCGQGRRKSGEVNGVKTPYKHRRNLDAKYAFTVGDSNFKLHCTFEKVPNQTEEYFLAVTEECLAGAFLHVGTINQHRQEAYIQVGRKCGERIEQFTEREMKRNNRGDSGKDKKPSSLHVKQLPGFNYRSPLQDAKPLDFYHCNYSFRKFKIITNNPHSKYRFKKWKESKDISSTSNKTDNDNNNTQSSSDITSENSSCPDTGPATQMKENEIEQETNNVAQQSLIQHHLDSRTDVQENYEQSLVCVHNLPSQCSQEQLLDCFTDFKSFIVNKGIQIITPKGIDGAPSSYSYTFLCFSSLEKAEEAVSKLNKKSFCGKQITVKLHSKPHDEEVRLPDEAQQSKPVDSITNRSSSCNSLSQHDTTTLDYTSTYTTMKGQDNCHNNLNRNDVPISTHFSPSIRIPEYSPNLSVSSDDPSSSPRPLPLEPLPHLYNDHLYHNTESPEPNIVHVKHSIGDSPLEPPYIQPPSTHSGPPPTTISGLSHPLEPLTSLANDRHNMSEDLPTTSSSNRALDNDPAIIHSDLQPLTSSGNDRHTFSTVDSRVIEDLPTTSSSNKLFDNDPSLICEPATPHSKETEVTREDTRMVEPVIHSEPQETVDNSSTNPEVNGDESAQKKRKRQKQRRKRNCDEKSSSIDPQTSNSPPSCVNNEPTLATNEHANKKTRFKFLIRVCNLPPKCTSKQLFDHFSHYRAAIATKQAKILPCGGATCTEFYAFLYFNSITTEPDDVIRKMNNTALLGRKICVQLQSEVVIEPEHSSGQLNTTGNDSNTNGEDHHNSQTQSGLSKDANEMADSNEKLEKVEIIEDQHEDKLTVKLEKQVELGPMSPPQRSDHGDQPPVNPVIMPSELPPPSCPVLPDQSSLEEVAISVEKSEKQNIFNDSRKTSPLQILNEASPTDDSPLPLVYSDDQSCLSEELSVDDQQKEKEVVPVSVQDDFLSVPLSFPEQSSHHNHQSSVGGVNPIPQLSPVHCDSSPILHPLTTSDTNSLVPPIQDYRSHKPKLLPRLQSYISSVITESDYDQITGNVRSLGIDYEEEIAKLNMEKDSEMEMKKDKLRSSPCPINATNETRQESTDASNLRAKKKKSYCIGIQNLPPDYTSLQLLSHLTDFKSAIVNKTIKIKPNIKKEFGHVASYVNLNFDSYESVQKVSEHLQKIKFDDGSKMKIKRRYKSRAKKKTESKGNVTSEINSDGHCDNTVRHTETQQTISSDGPQPTTELVSITSNHPQPLTHQLLSPTPNPQCNPATASLLGTHPPVATLFPLEPYGNSHNLPQEESSDSNSTAGAITTCKSPIVEHSSIIRRSVTLEVYNMFQSDMKYQIDEFKMMGGSIEYCDNLMVVKSTNFRSLRDIMRIFIEYASYFGY